MSVVSVTTGPRRGWKSVSTWIGAVIVGIAMLCAVFAPLLVPHDPFTQDLSKRLLPPFWMAGTNPDYILGTDQLGRDYLSRLIWGCRISMMIGVTVTVVSALIGITRHTLITLARERGYEVSERRLTRDDVYLADEAFFTGTAAEVVPIVELDRRTVGDGKPGRITAELRDAYANAVRGGEAAHREWLTPIGTLDG